MISLQTEFQQPFIHQTHLLRGPHFHCQILQWAGGYCHNFIGRTRIFKMSAWLFSKKVYHAQSPQKRESDWHVSQFRFDVTPFTHTVIAMAKHLSTKVFSTSSLFFPETRFPTVNDPADCHCDWYKFNMKDNIYSLNELFGLMLNIP